MAQYSIVTQNGKTFRKTILVRKTSRDNEFIPVAMFDFEETAREAMMRLNGEFVRLEFAKETIAAAKKRKAA